MCAVGADIDELPAAVTAHLQHRVHDQVDREVGAAEGHAERIDQEGHVVGDREHQGVRRLEAIRVRVGIEHAHQRAAGRAPRRESEMRQRRPGKMPRGTLGEILLRHAAEVGAQEALQERVATATAVGSRAGNALDQRDTCRGDAAEQPVIFNRNWRVHAQSSWSGSGGAACAWRILCCNGAAADPAMARDYTCRGRPPACV
jgi:hypothetical protein